MWNTLWRGEGFVNEKPKYEVTLIWDLDMDVESTSKVVTGLLALGRRQLLSLRPQVGFSCRETGRPAGTALVWLEVKRLSDGKRLHLALDLHDLSFQVYENALSQCDVYFKRSFFPPDLQNIASRNASKVLPFGFNFSCASNISKSFVCSWLMRLYTTRIFLAPKETLAHVRQRLGGYRVFLDGPVMRDFQQPPSVALNKRVVFQTRVWKPEEVGPDDHRAVNELRVGILRALRDGLGKQFIGGLVPTEFARQHFPDVLATAPARRQVFIRWSKLNLVGVYVRGLNYSCGFRFAEHLAASQCVVAHPDGFRNPAPVPPKEGLNFLAFTTPEECLEQCRRLLQDELLAQRMREANWEYYRHEVEPVQHIWNCLERAFAHADQTS